MREPDFSTIDGAVAGCFDNGKDIGILRVEYKTVDRILCGISIRSDGINFTSRIP